MTAEFSFLSVLNLTSLLAFNVGIELGQLLVLLLLVPALELLFRVVPERAGTIILSLLVGHTAWHWLTERVEVLRRFPWAAPDAAQLASALRWLMLLVALGALAWLARGALHRRVRAGSAKTIE